MSRALATEKTTVNENLWLRKSRDGALIEWQSMIDFNGIQAQRLLCEGIQNERLNLWLTVLSGQGEAANASGRMKLRKDSQATSLIFSGSALAREDESVCLSAAATEVLRQAIAMLLSGSGS